MRRSIVWAGLPALGLVLGGCSDLVERDERPVWAREETIEALGRAYIEVMPNQASFSVAYLGQAETPEEASALAITRLNMAVAAIREISDAGTHLVSQLSVSPYYEQITRRVGEFEEELVENRHPDTLLGYQARARLEVVTTDMDNIDLLRGATVALGPEEADNVHFTLQPDVDIQRRAFEAAVADATARAEIVAIRSNNTLGGLLLLREGSTSCLGREYGSPALDADRSDSIVVTGSRRGRDAFQSVSPIQVIDPTQTSDGSLSVAQLVDVAETYALSTDRRPSRVESRVCAVFAVD